MRRRRWSVAWLALTLCVGVILSVLATIPLLRGDASGRAGTLVGKPAPSVEAADLAGRTYTLANGEGRVTWVNFWAVSCEPCRTEMPAMQRLAEAYGDRLLVLGLNWGEEEASVRDFVDRYAISYPILLDPRFDNYFRWTSAEGLPRHYFVDGDGTVVREVIGPLSPVRMADLLEELIGPA